jgi:carbonic anhydrase
MEKLIRGVHQFQTSIFSSQQELFQRLTRGQQPVALFITCSDSRIDPNLLTQTKPGELFILRNAGNIVPPYGSGNGGEEATIEYALTALQVNDIIVCGHSHCGAMQGLLEPDRLTDMPSVKSWLHHAEATRRIMQEKYPEGSGEERLGDTVRENVLVQLKNLETHPSVAAKLASGGLKLHAWVYQIESGIVYAYEDAQGTYLPLAEAYQGGTTVKHGTTSLPARGRGDEMPLRKPKGSTSPFEA